MTRSEAGKLGGIKGGAISRQKALDVYYANPKYCKKCSGIIEVKDNERPCHTRIRSFCNNSCSARYNNKPRKPKSVCLCCGKLVRDRRARFCNRQCQGQHLLQNGKLGHLGARSFLIRRDGAKCSKCGWCELNPVSGKCPIILNHIDGNSTNMLGVNLELLCPNCDSLTPTYKALNRGNGRHRRRMRYQAGKSY